MRMKTNDRAIILSNLAWGGDVSITGTNHPPEHTDHHHTEISFFPKKNQNSQTTETHSDKH